MRVLITTMSYRPNVSGVAVFVDQLSRYLARQGHEVHIIAPNSGLKSTSERVAPNVTVHRLRGYPNIIRRGFYFPLFSRVPINRIVAQVQPNVIHANDPMAISRYSEKAGHRLGAPTIVSNHFSMDYVLAYFPKFLHPAVNTYMRWWMIKFYNRCDEIVAPSVSAADSLKRFGLNRPVAAISNGVDLHRFYTYFPLQHFRDLYGLPDRPLVLHVGRIDKDKSVDVLIKAFRLVAARSDAQLVIVGGGNKAKTMMRRGRRLLKDRVSFIGSIPHDSENLVALYQLATLFVIPSAIETQSISTLEAMAAGKPVVAARAGALPELVEDDRNGYLFEPYDPADLAAKLLMLLGDVKKQASFGLESLAVISRHELDQNLGLYEDLYALPVKKSV